PTFNKPHYRAGKPLRISITTSRATCTRVTNEGCETFTKNGNGMELKDSWKEINLGKSATLKARIGWQGLTTAEYLSSGDYFLVTGTDFLNGFIDWNNCVHVEKERYDQDKYIQLQ